MLFSVSLHSLAWPAAASMLSEQDRRVADREPAPAAGSRYTILTRPPELREHAVTINALAHAMGRAQRVMLRVGFFSFFINLLMLTAPLYMLQVYDRVLASRSHETLLYITLFAIASLLTMGLLEMVRSRILVRLGAQIDGLLSVRTFRVVLVSGHNGQAFRDLDALRGFLTGAGVLALLDAPWVPLYVGLVYLLHPLLGHVALAGAMILLAIGLISERATRGLLAEAGAELAGSTQFAEHAARNSEVVRAMGMLPGLMARWHKPHAAGLALQAVASDRAGSITATAKSVRFCLQVAVLGAGAYLVIEQQITAGAMIAASIIMGRGLAPVESAIGSWRGFLAARSSYDRLQKTLGTLTEQDDRMPLPAPRGNLHVDNLFAGPPDGGRNVINGVSFQLERGQVLGITGPSGAGKSSLVRLLVGVWAPKSGTVRLDGVAISDWRREEVGPYLGYLPQDIELFPGTVADNIARFGKVDAEQVVDAARRVGAHQMILELPAGYDTIIGPNGANLSGGQRQRIGLARALYGLPALIVLDEPTSNLDAEGEAIVRQALDELRSAGHTVIVIAHRPTLLGGTELLMVIQRGAIALFGPTSELMPQITRRPMSTAGHPGGTAQEAPNAL
ncbi:type I secretion system permease/ATPase [Aromatoleum anaerobium]|uniref:Type I secretion system permease/ATPase n=1 Tax=Aromatoleum anaerobium TaxID=182180 RepID=A0ABX1PJM6_9RHOO|nr:type I secretion system permease/ATPase [Aromatoleum anaerobium]MCK0505604.1 type I secretion system permease/ATPase [Aromatoleum anaerobium]